MDTCWSASQSSEKTLSITVVFFSMERVMFHWNSSFSGPVYSHVFSSPSERSERISDLVMGDLLRIVFPKNGPRQGRHAGSGGISCRGFFKVLMPSGVEGYVRKKDMEEFGKWAAGMKATGRNPETGLVEIVEVPSHPFFIGVQFHPELKSTPEHPQPIFVAFVKAAMNFRDAHKKAEKDASARK